MHQTITFFILLISCYTAYGQSHFQYQRSLSGVTDQWHKIVLSDDLFEQVSTDLSDLRILGTTAGGDTIEVPYLLRILKEERTSKEVNFNRLNTASNDEGYYFTFELPTPSTVSQIHLNFGQENFDWRLRLEGSQNQKDWYKLVEDYRILAINNGSTDFEYAKVKFSNANYRYYRFFIEAEEEPQLLGAKILQEKITMGSYNTYPIAEQRVTENRTTKKTEIELTLPTAVPVSRIKLVVQDTLDYYRPLTIQYLSDSVKTDKGWKYNYRTVGSGTLNSLEDNTFQLPKTTILKKMRVLLHNQDNRPLSVGAVEVEGYVHELVARFTEEADYYLVYGNPRIGKPHYDISQFQHKIPQDNVGLELGELKIISSEETPKKTPLFSNQLWLWVVMIGIILVLGWGALKMIKGR
ncbi:MAG: DUF3999 family protein [Bacteroidota bacterium]